MLAEQKIFISSAAVRITDRCNFRCDHCGLGDNQQGVDMTPADMETVMKRINGPLFTNVILYGGEPRVNRQLPQIAEAIRNNVHQSGRQLRIEVMDDELKNFRQEREEIFASIPEQERQKLQESGELSAMFTRKFLESDQLEKLPVSIEVFTNGFGMSSQEAIGKIANGLADQGVDLIAVSLDQPHRDFAQQNNVPIDYQTLEKVMRSDKVKTELGVPEGIVFMAGEIGRYVIPVGRAKNLLWEQRVLLARGGSKRAVMADIAKIRDELVQEFNDWSQARYTSHSCYCGPAKLRRRLYQVEQFTPENRIKVAGIVIDQKMAVNPCGFGVQPPVGNLKDQSVEEIYGAAVDSELYQILDREGPQGLARRLTDMPENAIKKAFLERTPCGLCEDLVQRYPEEINRMLSSKAK